MDISVTIRDDDDDDVPTDSRTFSEMREHESFLHNATLRMPVLLGYVATSRDGGRLMSVANAITHFFRGGRICEVLCIVSRRDVCECRHPIQRVRRVSAST